MSEEKQKILKALRIPLIFIILISVIKLSEYVSDLSFSSFGIFPRTLEGLPGIVLSPLLHSDYMHLFSNALPILVLGFGLFYFYSSSSVKVIVIIYLATNISVWLFARS